MPRRDDDRATREAARWLVALQDDPDDAELRRQVDAWLAGDPANEAAWNDTVHVYGLMARTPPGRNAEWDGRPIASRPGRHLPMGRRAAIGMMAALAACLFLVFTPGIVLRFQADQVTSTAEVRPVRLDDGSLVLLGADSAISVAHAVDGRGVRLLKGEAFFEVTPDPHRPFRVLAQGMETTVLGTSFNVRLAGDGAEVAVRTGLVGVASPAPARAVDLRLGAGDWVHVAADGKVRRGTMPPEEVAPWLHGQLVARDRPLADVVEDLRRYYRGTIVVAGDAFRGRRVTGVYNLTNPEEALRAIVGAHGGSVRRLSPWLLVAFGG
ncbi:MAG: FecR family protein [Pseudomonadota bacterium]